jgi:hypothetical protein
LKKKLFLLFIVFFFLGLSLIVQVKAADFSWKDNFNYANLQQMKDAGWTNVNPNGISFQPSGVVLDGTKADTIIRYHNFPTGIYDWSVETKSMWLGTGHSGPGINVFTEKHSYAIVADGWNSHFAFARDGKQVTFGTYKEQANVWITMTITKKNDLVDVYYNGALIYNYTEVDTVSYKLTGVDRIAPWHGVMLYDYYQVAGPDVVSAVSSGQFPIFYVAVGGGIAAIAVVGAAVYFFVIAGGGAGASSAGVGGTLTGGTAGAVGSTLGGAIGAVASSELLNFVEGYENILSNLFFKSVTDILADLGYDSSGLVAPELFGSASSAVTPTVEGESSMIQMMADGIKDTMSSASQDARTMMCPDVNDLWRDMTPEMREALGAARKDAYETGLGAEFDDVAEI